MKKNRLVLTALAVLALVPMSLSARGYYVSKNGSDTNAGTRKAPFLTIAKATSVMGRGDECIIMEGHYNEVIKSKADGTVDDPIIFTNYKNDRVVIDATQSVNGWSRFEGDIYKTNVELFASKGVYNTVYFNGKLLDVARWPNNKDDDRFTFDGHYVDGGSASHFESKDLPEADLTGAYFCYIGAHSGMTWSREITKYGNGEIHHAGVNIKKWPYTPHNPTLFRNNNRGQLYLFDHLALLDAPGEWFYDKDSKTLYAMFPDGVAPKDGEVRVGNSYSTVEFDNKYNVIDGLECYGGAITIKAEGCEILNSKVINASQSWNELIGISAQSETASIRVLGSDAVIENCLIEGGMTNGIMSSSYNGSEGVTVRNNVIRYFNSVGLHANPVRVRNGKAKILNNSIYTCGRDGISTFGDNCEIAYNDVFDCMRVNNDGGVFYTVGNTELKNSKIHHNYMHDSYGPEYADGRAAGIYLDNNSKGYDVYNNVIWNVTWNGFMFNWYNTDFNFFNNTIWNCGFNIGRWQNGYDIERIRIINNLTNVIPSKKLDCVPADKYWIGTEFAGNLVESESPFESVEECNFVPVKGSAVVDKGVVVEGVTKKYKGKTPDVGAYECGEKQWSVGASWAAEVFPKDFVYGKFRDAKKIYGQSEMEGDIFKKK